MVNPRLVQLLMPRRHIGNAQLSTVDRHFHQKHKPKLFSVMETCFYKPAFSHLLEVKDFVTSSF